MILDVIVYNWFPAFFIPAFFWPNFQLTAVSETWFLHQNITEHFSASFKSKMQSRAKQDARKKDFKKGITAEDSRRKREETSNEIRKTKREESLQKRRNIAPTNQIEITTTQSIHTEWSGNLSEIPQYIEAINSADPIAQLEATTQIRKLLSIEKNPPIAAVVQSGVLPRLIS